MQVGELLTNTPLFSGYFTASFFVPDICRTAQPGQFIHLRIDCGGERILRRPFSIQDVAEDGALSILYKVVGAGTERLSRLLPGTVCDLMGPLGQSFTPPAPGVVPVLVDGGYGAAATFLVAKRAVTPGYLLLGARTADDILMVDQYEACGFEVRVATNDGSRGTRGVVTDLLSPLREELGERPFRVYACGPHPMLMALARIMQAEGIEGELSLDHLMCCGVGACFACVVKVKDEGADGWRYARSCYEGPVFNAREIYTQ